MTAELRRGITLAILGLLAGLVLVAGFLGDGRTAFKRIAQSWQGGRPAASAPAPDRTAAPAAAPPATGATGAPAAVADVPAPLRDGTPAPKPDAGGTAAPEPRRSEAARADAARTEPGKAEPEKAEPGKPEPAAAEAGKRDAAKGETAKSEATKAEPGKPDPRIASAAPANGKALAPSFDVIRVEPSGEAVLAGRGAPGATIEMLRGGEPFARTLADSTGLFAIVPPPLPRGTSEISLRMIAPDGTRSASKDTAVIVVPQRGAAKPLIALTSPDKPTVVLSQPETAVAARTEPVPAAQAPGAKPAGQTPVKVVSVDAESGGRLFVTAQAPPGATVRLYLNDTLVAPAGAGQDGKVSFAIGRGVQAGQYRVRIDQVDPVSGEVRARSEVPFSFPTALALAPAAPGATTMSRSPEAEALVGKRVEDLARQQEHPAQRPAAPASAPGPQAALPQALAPRASAPQASAPAAAPAAPAIAAAAPPAAGSTVDAKGFSGSRVYVPEVSTATVSRGDNLWSISRKSYGRGARYTVIYDANQDQIRNPALIYPGQIFVMPQGGGATSGGDHQAERR